MFKVTFERQTRHNYTEYDPLTMAETGTPPMGDSTFKDKIQPKANMDKEKE